MLKKISLTAAVALAAMTAMPAAADAQPYGRGYGYYDNSAYAASYRDGPRRYQRGDYYGRGHRRYDNRRHYDRRGYNQRYYGQRYCRDSGTTGTIVGAIAGGLLGREVAGRGDRTVGTIVGGAAGALAGRAIDRNC